MNESPAAAVGTDEDLEDGPFLAGLGRRAPLPEKPFAEIRLQLLQEGGARQAQRLRRRRGGSGDKTKPEEDGQEVTHGRAPAG